jgi:hypothetical protein
MRMTGVACTKSSGIATVCVPQLCGHFVCTNSKRSRMPSSRMQTTTRLTQGEAGVT